jgi:hypothetical protein
MMRRYRYVWILVGLLGLASLACNAFAKRPLEPVLTRPGVPGSGDGSDVLPTAVVQNIAPTVTLPAGAPTTLPTAVAEPVDGDARLTALVDVNIRLGPGVAYGRDGFLLAGETAVVLGRHSQSGWWKIACPERSDGNVCWVTGGSQYTRVEQMSAAASPTPPPTATAESAEIEPVATPGFGMDFSTGGTGAAPSLPQMAYVDGGALWLLPINETAPAEAVRLVEAADVGRVLFSPNGRYVAYVTQTEADSALYLVDLQGGESQMLLGPADAAEMNSDADLTALLGQVQWLADSQSLAFNSYVVPRGGGPGLLSQADLWTVDFDGRLRERFPAGEGGGTFAVSPGNVVLFGQTTAVIRANLDGSERETLITFDFVNTASEFAFYPWLQWLDGGAATAVISSPEPYTTAEANLWRIPAAGAAEALAALPGNVIFSPVIWAGSGERLGYVRALPGEPDMLVIADGNGRNTVPYAEAARFFGWNPAGSHFVYAGERYYAVGRPGGDPLVVDVAEGKTAVSAQWLDDDTFIIALGSGGNWDFRLQTIDGPATRLVSGSATSIFDTWSP